MIRVIYIYHHVKNEFALNEARLQMRLFVRKGQKIRSRQDDEALMYCLP